MPKERRVFIYRDFKLPNTFHALPIPMKDKMKQGTRKNRKKKRKKGKTSQQPIVPTALYDLQSTVIPKKLSSVDSRFVNQRHVLTVGRGVWRMETLG